MLCGQGEVSLVFDKNNSVFARSLEIDNTKDVEPNKRALLFSQDITGDFIKGSVSKQRTSGLISVYLLIE